MMKRFHSGKSLLILCSLAGVLTLQAQTERDMLFSEKLNEIQLYDYCELFLRDLLAKNSNDPGWIRGQLIDSLLHQNKVEEAMDVYRKIPEKTEPYYRANGVLGVFYFNRDPKKALAYLQPVLEYCIKTKQDPKSWEKPATALFNLLKAQGKVKESEQLVEWLQGAQDQDERGKLYSQCVLRMDNVENAKKREIETVRRFNEAVEEIRDGRDNDKKDKLNELLQAKNNAEGQSADDRSAAYQRLGDFLKLDLTPMLNFDTYKARRAGIKNVFLKRAEASQKQIKSVREGDQNDWMTSLVVSMFDLENVQWGGQDVASAAAAALTVRGFYLLEEYAAGILQTKKFEDLFNGCDSMFAEEGHPELSPGSDARIWEGYCNLELARGYKKKGDDKNAKKHYIRAFKNFGAVLKNCPKHKYGPATFVTFDQVIGELSALSPNLAEKLQEEREKVPKPEAKASESEKLVSSMAEENFRQKNYPQVVDELMSIMRKSGNRLSTGFPELLNKLSISLVLSGDYLQSLAIADYMASILPEDPYTVHALKTCANLIWQKSVETEKNPKASPQEKAAAHADKDVAIDFYRLFLKVGISDMEAAPVAMRLANEFYNRANALGKALNAQKNQEARAEMKKDWIRAFDTAVKHYQFIIDNFGNREDDLSVSYLRAAECYVTTGRYEQAAGIYAKFCSSDPNDKVLLLQSKENVAESLYRSGSEHEKKSRSLLEAAAEVVVPDVPEKPVEPAKPEAAPEPVPGSQPGSSPEEENYKKALESYQRSLAEYENLSREAVVMKQKKAALEAQAKEEKAAANEFCRQAIAQLDELTQWLKPDSKVMEGVRKMVAAEKNAKKASEIEEKVENVRKLSIRLLPWLYDSIGDKQKAIAAFQSFIEKNKDRNDAKDNIPGYMMRIGMLYAEIGDDAKAQDVLTELSSKFPDSPEGKNAKFALAKNLYTNGTYDKALAIFKDIFSGPELNNLTVSNLRWIASQLSPCPSSQFARDAADYSYRASLRLLEKLKRPDYKEWVGDLKAIEFKNNKEAKALYDSQIAQKLNLDAGKAALTMEKYDEAIRYLSKVYELDKNTAYFNQLFFTRAEAYRKLKKYAEARKDLSRISSRAMARTQTQRQPKYWLYNKAQTKIGEIFMEENEPAKAYTIYSMVALPAISKNAQKIEPSGDPDDDSAKYVELAVYKAALTAAKTGRAADRKLFVDGYKTLYPKGLYLTEINNLPPADAKK